MKRSYLYTLLLLFYYEEHEQNAKSFHVMFF